MFRRLLQLLRFGVLGFPLWALLAGLAFIEFIDWLTGGQLRHGL